MAVSEADLKIEADTPALGIGGGIGGGFGGGIGGGIGASGSDLSADEIAVPEPEVKAEVPDVDIGGGIGGGIGKRRGKRDCL